MSLKFTLNDQTYSVGDTVKVSYKIKEKDKERVQAFDGVIISIKGLKENKNFLVRKIASDSVAVERIFPVNSPWISEIKKLRGSKYRIRRAKLNYLRNPKARTV